MNKISIAIADDHPLVLSGLKDVVNQFSERFELLWEAVDGLEVQKKIEASMLPDVLLLDINMPGKNGIELSRTIRKQYPSVKVIALTNLEEVHYARKILQQGASGYLLKTINLDELITAIEKVYEGDQYIDDQIRDKLVYESLGRKSSSIHPMLTRREKEVLKLILEQYTNPEIAGKLYLSTRTVEKHRISLIQKFGVKNTAGLVKHAIELGFSE